MIKILSAIRKFLNDRFNLFDDKAEENEIVVSIVKNVEFKGANLWALIFAIFIASIGLNVNSTAVIIGAMLISPIMGPIMGIGLGLGINDIELIRKASKNFLIAVIISICVSAIYFFITPLHEAQSELLARTTPTIWDVFIALFGGLAGIVAGTRKEKSNVIPGVAIATALMPPLCTAGFGLANGNFYYFFGAFYLFFINSLFICISTYLIVRYLKLPKKALENKEREKKVARYILLIVTVTALPSIYLAYRIVDKSIFETNVNTFLHHEFRYANTFIVRKSFNYNGKINEIDLVLIGEDLSDKTIDSLQEQLIKYKIKAKLVIHQGLNAKQEIDVQQIKANILADIVNEQALREKALTDTMTKLVSKMKPAIPDLRNELKSLYPGLEEYSITPSIIYGRDTLHADTVILFWEKFSRPISKKDEARLKNWLKNRIHADSIILISGKNVK